MFNLKQTNKKTPPKTHSPLGFFCKNLLDKKAHQQIYNIKIPQLWNFVQAYCILIKWSHPLNPRLSTYLQYLNPSRVWFQCWSNSWFDLLLLLGEIQLHESELVTALESSWS